MNRWFKSCLCVVLASAVAVACSVALAGERPLATSHERSHVLGSIQGKTLSVTVYSDGAYSITAPGIAGPVVRSEVEADVDSRVLRSSAYPQHTMVQSEFRDEFGTGSTLTVTHTGLPDSPDLIVTVRLFRDQSWGEIEVRVLNTVHRAISVQSIRSLHATDAPEITAL